MAQSEKTAEQSRYTNHVTNCTHLFYTFGICTYEPYFAGVENGEGTNTRSNGSEEHQPEHVYGIFGCNQPDDPFIPFMSRSVRFRMFSALFIIPPPPIDNVSFG